MATQLAKLKSEKAALEARRDIAVLESQIKTAETANRMVVRESWGDPVNTRETFDGRALTGTFGLDSLGRGCPISQPKDRWRGDNRPFWWTEAQQARIRAAARIIAALDEVGISALETLTNYIIGEGMTYKFTTNEHIQATAETSRLASQAQDILDRFIEQNDWWGDKEREIFVRSRRDGEQPLGLFNDMGHGGIPRVRIIDPNFVTEPTKPRALEEHLGLSRDGRDDALDWKYGLAAPWNDSADTRWMFVLWYGDENEWNVLPESRFINIKLNVDSEVKRGLSDYYPVMETLAAADKLLHNTIAGASVQSAISYIVEHADGVKDDQVKTFIAGRADRRTTETTPNGSRTDLSHHMKPATRVDIPHGAKYHAGPLGSPKGKEYLDIVQAALRIVGVRWQMPENMISGDASNANFASLLVAEAPFTKSSESKQTFYCRKYKEVGWKVLGMAHEAGLFPVPPRRAQRLLSLTCTGPQIAVRDRDEEHHIRQGEYEAGLLSLETWAAETNRDLAAEQAKGARPTPRAAKTEHLTVGGEG